MRYAVGVVDILHNLLTEGPKGESLQTITQIAKCRLITSINKLIFEAFLVTKSMLIDKAY